MGRVLLFAAVLVVGFFVIGTLLGILFTVLRWALILGLIGLAVAAVLRLTRGGRSDSYGRPY